jgi:uncharacterized protein (TIGR02246 family)
MMRMIAAALMLFLSAPAGVAGEAAGGVAAQVSAWNRGDLEGALEAYCSDPGVTWVNRSGVTRGFEAFAAAMRQDFADPAQMGRFEAEILETRALGRRAALVALRWSISRDGRRLMGGVSTQIWERCRGRLRITLEHAS